MPWIDGLGFCASTAVLAGFCMTTMVPLRSFAIASNVLFICYGMFGHIYPVLLLHLALLPINLVKLRRCQERGGPPQDLALDVMPCSAVWTSDRGS
jgi:hypothetical protein